MTRHIIPLGGHSLTKDTKANQYILNTTDKERPKIAFIGTATGDKYSYISKFYEAFTQLSCQPSHLELFQLNHEQWQEFLLSQDVIYVGGGNTFSMMSVWQAWGVDEILRQAYYQGTVMTGTSAGSICWFEGGNTDSFGSQLQPVRGLGFLPYTHSPHYDAEENRRPNYQHLIHTGELKPGYAIDNHAGLHFRNEELSRSFALTETAKSYWVTTEKSQIKEEVLETEVIS